MVEIIPICRIISKISIFNPCSTHLPTILVPYPRWVIPTTAGAEVRQDAVADTVHAAVGAQIFQAATAGVVHLPWDGLLDRHGIGFNLIGLQYWL